MTNHNKGAIHPGNGRLTRREAIKSAGLLTGGALLSGALLGTTTTASAQDNAAPTGRRAPALEPSDLAIANFALVLELMEQDLYTRALQADTERDYLKGRLGEIVAALRDNEAAHIGALTNLITQGGGAPPAPRTFNFPPEIFISPIAFSHFAYVIAEIGVGAYLGAIERIRSDSLRRTAASIYGVEARHAALLRHRGGFEFSPRYYEGALTMEQVQQLVAPYMAG